MKKTIRLIMVSLLALALVAAQKRLSAQEPTLQLAGVDLHIGMDIEPVLAAIAKDDAGIKVTREVHGAAPDGFFVMFKDFASNQWKTWGEISAKDGKIVRISRTAYSSNSKEASSFAKAVYDALNKTKATALDWWVESNGSASNPDYAVHFRFADREVVVSGGTFSDVPIADVATFYPRVITAPPAPKP